MREYYPLYSKTGDSWSIIFKDLGEDTFYVYADNLDQAIAKEIAEALNERGR